VSPPAALDPAGLRVVGDGAQAYPDVFGEVPAEPRYPSAARIAELVDVSAPATPLVPLYLRRPDAEQPGPPKRVTA
jgi:tRNA threonylcarbamoyladenosine biosynthesis protein TsaB